MGPPSLSPSPSPSSVTAAASAKTPSTGELIRAAAASAAGTVGAIVDGLLAGGGSWPFAPCLPREQVEQTAAAAAAAADAAAALARTERYPACSRGPPRASRDTADEDSHGGRPCCDKASQEVGGKCEWGCVTTVSSPSPHTGLDPGQHMPPPLALFVPIFADGRRKLQPADPPPVVVVPREKPRKRADQGPKTSAHTFRPDAPGLGLHPPT